MTSITESGANVFDQNRHIEGSSRVDGDLTCVGLSVSGDLVVSGAVIAGHSLHVGGDLHVGKHLDAGLQLRVAGNVVADGHVNARRIEVNGSLSAGGAVVAIGSIIVGGDLSAQDSIEAGVRLHAGGAIRSRGWVLCPGFDIRCQELSNRLLPLGREFWASLPALAQWRDQILDPALDWNDWRLLAAPEARKELADVRFGHWSLEGQLRVFAGIDKVVVPPDDARAPPTLAEIRPRAPEVEPAKPRVRAADNPLIAIVNDPAKTPFPDYTGNASYQAIAQQLKQQGLLDEDLRAAYVNLNIDLDPIYAAIERMTVPDPTVKTQVLKEIAAASNVHTMTSNMKIFINSSILAKELRVTYVGGMVSVTDGDACSFDVEAMFNDVLDALSALPGVGGVFTLLGAIVGLVEDGWSGGFQSVDAAYDELEGALSAQFTKSLDANGKIAQTLLTDWGKLQRTDALIIDGTLAWPADDSQLITAASNRYEINVFKVLLPIHWSPIFSYMSFGRDTREGCGNTVWMQGGGWGSVLPSQGVIPYWLTWGGLWEADLSTAENELASIGVSIWNLTMGTGVWGSTIWAWNRANPVGVCNKPSCVAKN